MDQSAPESLGDATKKGRSRMGMKGLIGAVALCALIVWAGVSIRDHLEGYQPLRAIRSRNAIERRTAAQFLSGPEREIDSEVAMAALIPTLGDEDATVRASGSRVPGVGGLQFAESPGHRSGRLGSAEDADWCRDARVWLPCCQTGNPRCRAAAAIGLATMARLPPRSGLITARASRGAQGQVECRSAADRQVDLRHCRCAAPARAGGRVERRVGRSPHRGGPGACALSARISVRRSPPCSR